MRYLIALVVAALVIASILAYAGSMVFGVESAMQEKLKEKKRSGEIPADVELNDVGFQLPASEMRKLTVGRGLLDFWFVWSPILIGISLVVARFAPRKASAPNDTKGI